MKRCLIVCLLYMPCVAFGQLVENEDSFNLRLQPYEPSYAIWRYAKGDDQAATAHYSFRYLLTPQASRTKCGAETPCSWESEAFLTYTGEFDFYWGQRPSSPVVNRLNNPGVHWRWAKGLGTWLDLGLEHRSNGQSLDVADPEVRRQAEQAYVSGRQAFFDGISRSSNFLIFASALRTERSTRADGQEFHAKAKLYFSSSEESEVVWGPLAARRTNFSDYDRVRLTWRAWQGGDKEFSAEAVLGDRGLATNSWNVDAAWYVAHNWLPKLEGVAFYLRFHQGPMLTLSNYTQSQRAIGIGLRLVPFVESYAAAIK